MKKIEDYRALSDEELNTKITDLREEHFNLKFQNAVGKLENTARLKFLRRDIARCVTLKSERKA